MWNYAVNVLQQPVPDEQLELFPFAIEMIEDDNTPHKAYSLLDIELYNTKNQLTVVYRYSATHYREQSIRRFADMVKQHLFNILR